MFAHTNSRFFNYLFWYSLRQLPHSYSQNTFWEIELCCGRRLFFLGILSPLSFQFFVGCFSHFQQKQPIIWTWINPQIAGHKLCTPNTKFTCYFHFKMFILAYLIQWFTFSVIDNDNHFSCSFSLSHSCDLPVPFCLFLFLYLTTSNCICMRVCVCVCVCLHERELSNWANLKQNLSS